MLLNVPVVHSVHTVGDTAADTAEYLPSLHGRQSPSASLPVVARYVPATQLKHVADETAADTAEYLPLLHGTQFTLPIASAYFPALQSAQPVADKPEYFPISHSTHMSNPFEYLPFAHSMQVMLSVAWYLPGTQKTQAAISIFPVEYVFFPTVQV